MAALASRVVVKPQCAARPSARPAAAAKPRGPLPCRAIEMDGDTLTLGLAALAGVGFGIGLPVLFTRAEKRDRERIEELRELNRATLKATGETLSEVRGSAHSACRRLERRAAWAPSVLLRRRHALGRLSACRARWRACLAAPHVSGAHARAATAGGADGSAPEPLPGPPVRDPLRRARTPGCCAAALAALCAVLASRTRLTHARRAFVLAASSSTTTRALVRGCVVARALRAWSNKPARLKNATSQSWRNPWRRTGQRRAHTCGDERTCHHDGCANCIERSAMSRAVPLNA
jgi:hypothetical protein